MMKKRLNKESSSGGAASSSSAVRDELEAEWEMRPGGMLVQKRSVRTDAPPPQNLRLRIAYGALRYEISVSSMATFGEVKKVLSGETGLGTDEQRVVYRGKERENGEYLDMCGVKDRSKVVLVQDPASIERRFLQMRRNAQIQSAQRAIDDVAAELDQLAQQVSEIEKSISKGVKVAEVQMTTLIEMLMREAIKLESICAEGGSEASAQKDLQGKRVQKCVEKLDILKACNAAARTKQQHVVVTTKWETFDHSPPPPPSSNHWELFD